MRKLDKIESKERLISVALNLPVEGTFTYSIEQNGLLTGFRVLVDFRGRKLSGIICAEDLTDESKKFKIKKAIKLLDDIPIVKTDCFETANWISKYYCCSFGEALHLFAPFQAKGFRAVAPIETNSADVILKLPELNSEQQTAFLLISKSIKQCRAAALLEGVTGSGKTAVYMRLIAENLDRGGQSLVLIPEIGLTPQTQKTFTNAFGSKNVSVIHSKISSSKKYSEWQKICSGERKIIIGARSALFAPFSNLKLAVIDEEHDGAYKNNSSPRYHSIQMAQQICKKDSAFLLLSSATPLIETRYFAETKKIDYAKISTRYFQSSDASIEVVPPPEEPDQHLHSRILEELKETRLRNEQAIVYLNRRGFANALICNACSHIVKCSRCAVSLTWHRSGNLLLCHYCGLKTEVFKLCPKCGSSEIKGSGAGIEKAIENIERSIAGIRILRMDSDTIVSDKILRDTLEKFSSKEADVLAGTQMVVKGHDFPDVTLIAVINPELTLALPDFRSEERAFSQLAQVSGRAGRRKTAGKIMVQTAMPEEKCIMMGMKQNYDDFYKYEIAKRELFGYPPFAKLMRVVFRGEDADLVSRQIFKFQAETGGRISDYAEVLGPSPCVIQKLNKQFRWNLLYKIKDVAAFVPRMKQISEMWNAPSGIHIEYDMDPSDMF